MCVVEFSFHVSSYYTAISLSPHSRVFCCKQRGENYKFQKLHYPLEHDYGLKKIGKVQEINVQVCMFLQGPHLAKHASKGIYKIRKIANNSDISIFGYFLLAGFYCFLFLWEIVSGVHSYTSESKTWPSLLQ